MGSLHSEPLPPTDADDGRDIPPDGDPRWLDRAEALAAAGRPAAAAAAFARAGGRRGWQRQGNMLKAGGLLAQAEAAYRKALAAGPADPTLLRQLANSIREQGRPAEAEALYRQALAQAPGDPALLVQLAQALIDLGLADEARTLLLPLALTHPDEPALERTLARTLTGAPSDGMDAALARAVARGVGIASVIDVGASNGSWTLRARRHWPSCRSLLIEAFEHWREELDLFVRRWPGTERVIAVAGPQDGGTATFFNDPDRPYGGILSGPAETAGWQVPQISIDGARARAGLPGPLLLKLDTHGAERAILEGARETLKDCALVVIEAYNLPGEDRCPRFDMLVAEMERLGFRCADLADPMRRPSDGLLWQMDLLFIPAGDPCFARLGFDTPQSTTDTAR